MKFLRNHDDVANELAHISAMIQRLEQLVRHDHDHIDLQATVVTLPAYWRARIEANLDVPPELEPQAQVLLHRLDAIDAVIEQRAHTPAGC
ncbi:hypothetical protein [Paraburkholderia sp. ZP32-5]|uniref:hypothetical protein n=1 Tax=Paraburkholderia sp. ZP32-5 TaxID=2883245 RepID=UPI001F2E43EF|nr:hypothetical protein [Paraburkholderia sp. ZP32-5]